MSVRYFFSLPALPDVATVDAAADKLGAHRVAGYRGFDGLRACVSWLCDRWAMIGWCCGRGESPPRGGQEDANDREEETRKQDAHAGSG